MWFRSMLQLLARPSRRPARLSAIRKQQARRLLLEGLEDRRLLTFASAASYPVGGEPAAVVAADLNNDGLLDLATANNSTSSVSVLLGNPDGTFQAVLNSPTGAGPLSVAVGDFNDDGKLDLVTANSGDVSLLLGNGGGGFTAAASVGVSSIPSSVAVGDFNADGKMDLAVGGHTSYYIPPWFGGCGYYGCYGGGGYWVDQPSVSVLMGNGSGGFGAETLYQPAGSGSTTALTAADLNGDGLADLAAATGYGSIAVLLSTGAAGLSPNPIYSSGLYAQSLVAADTNGDSKLDLVAANGYGVGVLPGDGLGSFPYDSTRFYSAGAAAQSAGVADFNGDGKADIATANSDGSVSVLLGTGLAAGGSAYKPPVIIAGAGSSLGALAIGKFNGDARPDLAATSPSGNTAAVLLNDGLWPALDAPSISIADAAAVTEGNSGTVDANFTISLSAPSAQTVTVAYSTADGTATSGSDYQPKSQTLTFNPGETSQVVSIAVNGDRVGESAEGFSVKLTNPTNAFISRATAQGTILDDEPVVSIVDYASSPEGNTGTSEMSFAVTLSAPYDQPVTVDYATTGLTPDEEWWYGPGATAGDDYIAASGTVTFLAGQTTQTIQVPIVGDRTAEPDELFSVNLSNPDGALLSTSHAIATIANDEPSVWIDYNASQAEGNSGTSTMRFTVHLSAPYDVPVTVNYVTQDSGAVAGSDYIAAAGTVTIAAGTTTAFIDVQIIGDTVQEGDEYFYVSLTAATYASLGNSYGAGQILDDDTPPEIYIDDPTIYEGNSGTQTMPFTVYLTHPSGTTVSVNYATVNGTAKTSDNDYVATSGTLTFAPGETSKTIYITVRGDTRKESNEYFLVKLSSPTDATISDGQGQGTILNDDGSTKRGKHNSQAALFDAALDELLAAPKKRRS
jgi:hypothetical protein